MIECVHMHMGYCTPVCTIISFYMCPNMHTEDTHVCEHPCVYIRYVYTPSCGDCVHIYERAWCVFTHIPMCT